MNSPALATGTAPSFGPDDARTRVFRSYLHLTGPVHLLALVALLALSLWMREAGIWFLFAIAAANTLLTLCSYGLARNNHLQSAISVYVAGLGLVVAALFAFGDVFYPIATATVFLPVMMSMPYMTDRGILLCSALMTVIFAIAAVTTVYPAPLSLDMSTGLRNLLIAIVVTIIVAVAALTLWYNARLLHQAAENSVRANLALRRAERDLEAQVESRTAELVQATAELEIARDQAVNADAQTTDFLGKMSHELRTPLNAIIGFSEMLERQYFGPLTEKQNEYVGDILTSANHLLLLINDVLDLSKVETGRIELEEQEFELAAMLNAALLLVAQRATRQGIHLNTDIARPLGSLCADQRKLKQVVINLLTNAVKFTANAGQVTLGAARGPDSIEVWIQDDGKGIAPEDQKLIFEPFRQTGDAGDAREGTGLGLWLSRQIVEMHGGRLAVSSTPGMGSRFSFSIPFGGSRR